LKNGDLNKRQTRKANKAINGLKNQLSDWQSLNSDFNNIIDSEVLFEFNSTGELARNENGITGQEGTEVFTNTETGELGGKVVITIRPGHQEAVIHENRHGNQILNRDNGSVLGREVDAFNAQKIFDAKSVERLIEKYRNEKFWHLNQFERERRKVEIDDVVRKLYKKEIEN